jgi:cytochrome c oxidase subunit 3
MLSGAVLYMHSYILGNFLLPIGFLFLLSSMGIWWRDVVREATMEERHTLSVQKGIRLGMLLFIISEVMFFFGFFWAFFHAALAPTVELGSIWPPVGIIAFNPWGVPLCNTLILLLSGATITWTHHAILISNRMEAFLGFCFTLVLALAFTSLQVMEYLEAAFNISDSVYGSTFYMATGFHGFHVIVGTCFIFIALIRLYYYHLFSEAHFGFEASAWYWHFVDIVWLVLYITIYWWGSVSVPLLNTSIK